MGQEKSFQIPFDQYQRYKKIEEIVEILREDGQVFTILEVGANEHKNLEKFLLKDKITYLDIELPDNLINDSSYIQGDATQMPLNDEQFDIIVSLDVFEHIAPERRKNFLDEMCRVAQYGFVLAAPFNTEGVIDAERRVNEYFKTLYGFNYPWLEEHLSNGLPELEETLLYLKDKVNFKNYEHGSLYLWEKLTRMHFAVAGKFVFHDYRATIDNYYNNNIYPFDFQKPCYRNYIIGIKDSKKVNLLDNLNSNAKDVIALADFKKFNDLEESFYSLITRCELKQFENELELKNEQLKIKDALIKSKDEEINIKQLQIQNLEEQVKSLRIKGRIKRFIKIVVPNPILNKIRARRYVIQTGYDPKDDFNLEKIEADINSFASKPLISVVMPVYNVEPQWLELAIKSVQNQLYANWELCIADDCSTNQSTLNYLKSVNDQRIKIKFLKKNLNISAASNEAASMATGEYIALLDHDDVLTRDAFYEVTKAINETNADFIYSDEDKIDKQGKRSLPFFKPDWSPDLLRSQMYTGHLCVFTKQLFEAVGGFRVGFEGSQDYDLALRMTETNINIYHIPKVLYSWRQLETSTAINAKSKPYAQDAGLKALNEHCLRLFGEGKAWAEEVKDLFVYDVRYKLSEPKPLVSIIIPTKDKIDLLESCVKSILEKTVYPNYEILILDNNSEQQKTKNWFAAQKNRSAKIRIIEANYEFNWSKLNNHGIREAKGDVLIFLNNDTVVISADWLDRLAEKSLRDDVGTVGALLLYLDGTIQHAGVVVGMGGWADHVYKGIKPIHTVTPFISPVVTRNVTASTGACLAISRKTIEKIGEFSEDFIICGSDVEISLRAINNNLVNIYDPHVKLYHLESKTRTSFIPQCDYEFSEIHYKAFREKGDPYYNKNLSLESTTPKIRQDV